MLWNPDQERMLNEAEKRLKAGEPVAIPTETVYGLAAPFQDEQAIARIFELKGRPSDNPLIVHIAELDELDRLCHQPTEALKKWLPAFWPGPLSIVIQARTEVVPSLVRAGLDTVAVRMPRHPMSLELIRRCGPLVAPSANKSGYPSPTEAQHVRNDYDEKVYVVDGGPCESGLESTVLDLHQEQSIRILRPGAIGRTALEQHGVQLSAEEHATTEKDETYRSPGMRHRHYAPHAQVQLIRTKSQLAALDINGCMVLAFHQAEGVSQTAAAKWIDYRGDISLMAKELFMRFREADQLSVKKVIVYVEDMPENAPLANALINRVSKAEKRT
jgi:L-threonylcarbamoyladenylate synthase